MNIYTHRNEECSFDVIDSTAGEGHIEAVQWLLDNKNDGCTRHAMDNAAANGHCSIVKRLHEHRFEARIDMQFMVLLSSDI